jgi:hypothetical protein
MATASVSNTFVSGTAAIAADVNTNFSDITGFINTECIQKDASLAFTSIPSGPATDPTSANQFTRKAYVDAKAPRVVGFKPHSTTSLWVDTHSSKTELGVNFTFTMPTLLAGQYLKVSAMIPEFELGQDSAFPEGGFGMKVYLHKDSDAGTILAYGKSSVSSARGFAPEGSPSLYFQRLWTPTDATASIGAAGATITVKSYGLMEVNSTGKWRLQGSAGAPIQYTVEVV